MDSRLTAKLSRIYYSPRGYWRGVTAIKHLASAAKVSEDVAKDWLKRQAIWQIYLPAPRRIPRPRFDVSMPNKVHQADLLFLPHDRLPRGKKVYKYALTVVDVASRFKEAESLTSKTAAEVADALSRIYKRGPLKWPKLLQVDPGREFMGAAGQLLAKHGVSVRRGRVDIHRDQGVVERFNRTLAERLFGHQQAQELVLMHMRSEGSGERSREWVKRLPAVIAALNGEVTRLTGKRPRDAIKKKTGAAKSLFSGPRSLGGSRGGKTPLQRWCSLSLSAWRAGRRAAQESHWRHMVSSGVSAWSICHQDRRARALLFAGR